MMYSPLFGLQEMLARSGTREEWHGLILSQKPRNEQTHATSNGPGKERPVITTMPQQGSQNQHAAPIAANLGLARPPFIYLTAIIVGLILHFVWPVPLAAPWAKPFGALIVILAAALFIGAVRTFRSAGTPVPGNQPTTTIVKVGPYRFSRNPIYLAFSLFQIGIALAVNDAWILITLLLSVSTMSFVVIPREERYLEGLFGEEYTTYKASVRRWL